MNLVFARAAALAAAALTAGAAPAAEPIPIEQFFQQPAMSGAALSPDGRHLALRMRSPRMRSMLVVLDTASMRQTAFGRSDNGDVGDFAWNDDRELEFRLINFDVNGNPVLDRNNILPVDGKPYDSRDFIVMPLRSFADADGVNNSYLDNVSQRGFTDMKTGKKVKLGPGENNDQLLYDEAKVFEARQIIGWFNDESGHLRVAVTHSEGKNRVFYDDGGKQWRQVAAFDPQARDGLMPVLYAGGALYVRTTNGRDTAAIYRYDLAKNQLDATPLLSVPGYDADGYFVLDDQKLLGFRVNTDSETTAWLDQGMQALQEEIDALMPATVNTLSVGAHSATPLVLVDAHSDVQDHLYLLYHRDTKKLQPLGMARPELDLNRMGHMSMVNYPARDGLRIPAYLTLPAAPATKPAPLVVLMGDTQWKRNGSWEWHAEVQFLASRGYAVLQPNPRGTPGFGSAHEAAGEHQWGRAMQDDIADGAAWAVAQGYADPARICIAGSGYGGYAAMMALARGPALFKCGVSWSGYTDLPAMFDRDWKFVAAVRNVPALYRTIGDPKQDAALLRQISPLYNAAGIRQPVLLAYGLDDRRIPYNEGRNFYDQLAAANPRAEWLKYSPSVDINSTQANRIDLWRHIESFLAKNIGP